MLIQKHYPLKPHNTFGFDVKALYYAAPANIEELKELLADPAYNNLPRLILGGGSNLLLRGDVEGLVIHPQSGEINVSFEDNEHVYVEAGAGVIWDDLVAYCVKNNWGGLENLSGIPGNVGAAPVQNIGAYGVEVKDCIASVEALEIDSLETRRFTTEACGFGYRNSIFKQDWKNKLIITRVRFRLDRIPRLKTHYGSIAQLMQTQPDAGIQQVREAVLQIRREKLPDPAVTGNAGSFFKNPTVSPEKAAELQAMAPRLMTYPAEDNQVKIPAGWLIEQAGWKGKRIGNVGVHNAQALVLVNYGNGSGNEVLQLAEAIQQSVAEKFGIRLEMEVNVV